MDHEKFVEAVAASMESKQEAINPTMTNEEASDALFLIEVPLTTGYIYPIDIRRYKWEEMCTPENKKNIEANKKQIRDIVRALVTLDFTDPQSDELVKSCTECLMDFFKGFGIDPHYDELQKDMMVKPYIILFAMCTDAMEIMHATDLAIARYELSSEKFAEIINQIQGVTNLNDITDMDNSLEGLISEDRINYGGIPDDHDVSGLLEEL